MTVKFENALWILSDEDKRIGLITMDREDVFGFVLFSQDTMIGQESSQLITDKLKELNDANI